MKSIVACLAALACAAFAVGQALSALEAALKTASLTNVKKQAMAMLMYAGDNDDTTPYVSSSMSFFAITRPYLASLSVCVAPRVGSRYQWNVNFGGTIASRIEDPSMTPFMHETMQYTDGAHIVGYADAHVKAVSRTMWPKTLAALAKKHQRPRGIKPLPTNHYVETIPKVWRDLIARGGPVPLRGMPGG